MNKTSKIYVAGHDGLVGSALMRKLRKERYLNIIYREHRYFDLRHQSETEDFFASERPEYVFLAAAKGEPWLYSESF
jgi:GDP-L-fucose synthase